MSAGAWEAAGKWIFFSLCLFLCTCERMVLQELKERSTVVRRQLTGSIQLLSNQWSGSEGHNLACPLLTLKKGLLSQVVINLSFGSKL